MIAIPHTLNLVTILDEENSTSQKILSLPNPEKFLADIFESFLLDEKLFEK